MTPIIYPTPSKVKQSNSKWTGGVFSHMYATCKQDFVWSTISCDNTPIITFTFVYSAGFSGLYFSLSTRPCLWRCNWTNNTDTHEGAKPAYLAFQRQFFSCTLWAQSFISHVLFLTFPSVALSAPVGDARFIASRNQCPLILSSDKNMNFSWNATEGKTQSVCD